MSLEEINQRLKVAKAGVTVIQRGNRLALRATLPPKSGDVKSTQQIVSLGVFANPAGFKRAESEALRLSSEIALGRFDWQDWREAAPIQRSEVTAADLISDLEADYFAKRKRTATTESTWRIEYLSMLSRLKPGLVTTDSLLELIKTTEPDTRQRIRACMVAWKVAKFLSLEFDVKPYRGNYGVHSLTPRDLPTDQEIARQFWKIKSRPWQYVFGLMATYGLRNHEVFLLDLESLKTRPGVITVLGGKNNKTHRVWPYYPEWFEEFELWRVELLPQVNGKTHRDLGDRVTKAFKRNGVEFSPYNLRHAWAVRTLEFGLDISLAAAQMDHSVQVHSRIYHHWIAESQQQRAFDNLVTRPGRPLPP